MQISFVLWVVTLCSVCVAFLFYDDMFAELKGVTFVRYPYAQTDDTFEWSEAVRPKGCFKNGHLKRVKMCGVPVCMTLSWMNLQESWEVYLKKCHFCTPTPKSSRWLLYPGSFTHRQQQRHTAVSTSHLMTNNDLQQPPGPNNWCHTALRGDRAELPTLPTLTSHH